MINGLVAGDDKKMTETDNYLQSLIVTKPLQ